MHVAVRTTSCGCVSVRKFASAHQERERGVRRWREEFVDGKRVCARETDRTGCCLVERDGCLHCMVAYDFILRALFLLNVQNHILCSGVYRD